MWLLPHPPPILPSKSLPRPPAPPPASQLLLLTSVCWNPHTTSPSPSTFLISARTTLKAYPASNPHPITHSDRALGACVLMCKMGLYSPPCRPLERAHRGGVSTEVITVRAVQVNRSLALWTPRRPPFVDPTPSALPSPGALEHERRRQHTLQQTHVTLLDVSGAITDTQAVR